MFSWRERTPIKTEKPVEEEVPRWYEYGPPHSGDEIYMIKINIRDGISSWKKTKTAVKAVWRPINHAAFSAHKYIENSLRKKNINYIGVSSWGKSRDSN